MKGLKAVALATLLVGMSAINAHAIGDRERGALIGAGAMLLLPTMVNSMGNLFGGYQERYQTPARVIHHQPVQKVYVEPIREVIYVEKPVREYNSWGRHNKDIYEDENVIIIYK